jgi:hypothetical protein
LIKNVALIAIFYLFDILTSQYICARIYALYHGFANETPELEKYDKKNNNIIYNICFSTDTKNIVDADAQSSSTFILFAIFN